MIYYIKWNIGKKGFFMKFSNESIEMLLDLVEIKISSLFVYDKEDSKELKKLKKCRSELCKQILENQQKQKTGSDA